MKKLLLLSITAFIILLSQTESQAQQTYKNALGGRFGEANGVTFKTFVNNQDALDFILNFQSRGNYSYFRLTGLYEVHKPFANAQGLRYYYGAGGTLGQRKDKRNDDSDLLASIDGVLGLDYKFDEAPINVSLDWKPALVVTPYTEFDARGLGLSVRFTF
ncbi:hypothetical protein [Daejeonella oryzae]|uniref:hypothetical protein n=1 Tax=Daejeonella oryzae TaxID=1122943 RepID=UPI000401A4CD|nr:hypothetical protein [Daejeonella oryzae]